MARIAFTIAGTAAALLCQGRGGSADDTIASTTPPHSVSGFSGGASLAVNHLVSFSDLVLGMGIIGGSPYGCGTVPDCGNSCSGFQATGHLENKSIPWTSWVDGIRRGYLEERAAKGLVAPLAHLVGKPVYLFSGLDDVWVYQSVMRGVEAQFANLSARIKSEFSFYAAHSWVVDNQTCAQPGVAGAPDAHAACCGIKGGKKADARSCAVNPAAPYRPQGCCGTCAAGDGDDRKHTRIPMSAGWRPPINSCGYDMTGEILRWVLGAEAISPRRAVVPANLHEVQQARFLPANWTAEKALLDDLGYVYVPAACRASEPHSSGDSDARAKQLPRDEDGGHQSIAKLFSARCRIHVHYHPCGGSIREVGLSYMLENAIPAYAEGNDMVILYPQSASVGNPAGSGCWDWYGAVGPLFDTRLGTQLNFVLRMMRELREEETEEEEEAAPY